MTLRVNSFKYFGDTTCKPVHRLFFVLTPVTERHPKTSILLGEQTLNPKP